MGNQVDSIGMKIKLSLDMATAQEIVTEALMSEGFGVLTEIDVQATLKKKLDMEYKPYKILGACNPKLAHKALEISTDVGLLLPCNVTLQQSGESSIEVSIVDPLKLMSVADYPELKPIAEEAERRMRRVISTLENG